MLVVCCEPVSNDSLVARGQASALVISRIPSEPYCWDTGTLRGSGAAVRVKALKAAQGEVKSRALEPISVHRTKRVLSGLTEIARYRHEGYGGAGQGIHKFRGNEPLWNAILGDEKLTENSTVELYGFWISEWLPLRPGLFHTSEAKSQREIALSSAWSTPDDRDMPSPIKKWLSSQPEGTMVFPPDAKTAMIAGGIGCVRLKPLQGRSASRWLMGASSSRIVHEGVPLALDDPTRDRIINDVRRHGGLRCSVRGVLRFVPSDDALAATYARRVPQLYLEATDVTPLDDEAPPGVEVSAVVTFVNRSEERPRLNAGYATFVAGKAGEIEAASEWLAETYVGQSYNGKVLTDFDEQTGHFAGATFSLARLLEGSVDRDDAEATLRDLVGPDDTMALLETLNRRGVFVAGDAYIVGQAAAVGPKAVSRNATILGNDPRERK